MAALIVLYALTLVVSAGFFVWAIYAYVRGNQGTARSNLSAAVGPDMEPTIVALYCQYLLAPQQALREAQEELSAVCAVQHRRLHKQAEANFLQTIEALSKLSSALPRGR